MTKSKFSKPPVIDKGAIEEKAANFIEGGRGEGGSSAPPKKVKTKALFLRIPATLWNELHALAAARGLSVNAVCSEMLRKRVKHASTQDDSITQSE